MTAGRRAAETPSFNTVRKTQKEGNIIPFESYLGYTELPIQPFTRSRNCLLNEGCKEGSPLLVGSVAPPAPVQVPREQNNPFSCFSSMSLIIVNYKTPVMTMERQIDLFLLIVLNLAGVMGTQISHLVMALPGVDISTIGT